MEFTSSFYFIQLNFYFILPWNLGRWPWKSLQQIDPRLASESNDPIVASGKFIYFYHFLTAIFLYHTWSVPKRKGHIR